MTLHTSEPLQIEIIEIVIDKFMTGHVGSIERERRLLSFVEGFGFMILNPVEFKHL